MGSFLKFLASACVNLMVALVVVEFLEFAATCVQRSRRARREALASAQLTA